jgi:hypothetical protein
MRVSQRHVEELAVNDLCLAQHAEEGAVVAVHVNQANRNVLAGDLGGGVIRGPPSSTHLGRLKNIYPAPALSSARLASPTLPMHIGRGFRRG